jgi:large subunit ribosomal protein L6
MDVPAGISVTVDNNTKIEISGADKQLLGQFASEVRAKRPPEPFKGKGVKYAEEYIVRKEGKKK